jgi:peptidoglycan/LPS O-acetylase OafA/YrhL
MPWWSYATFSQNIMMGMRGTFGGHFLAATWSLAVEEQFYLVAPIIAVLLGRKGLVIAIPVMAVCAVVLRKCFPGFHCYVNMPFRLDSLACGMAISVLLRTPQVWSQCVIYRSAFLAASVGFMIATLVVIYARRTGGLSFLWWTALYGCTIFTVLLHQGAHVTAVLRSQMLAYLSRLSYGLYLFHQPVLGLTHAGLRGAAPSLDDSYAAFVTALSFSVSITVAWLVWHLVERKAVNFGKQVHYGEEC